MNKPILPGSTAPALDVKSLNADHPFSIAQMEPKNFKLLFFYRGVHCPKCKDQLEELNERVEEFRKQGIEVAAISMDSEERARRQRQDWNIGNLRIGYEMSREDALNWGLYLSRKEKDAEPDLFSEPGIAVLYPDDTIYALYYQTVPFARPMLDDLLSGLDFIAKNDYPIRGKVA
ncbi:redoxin domain-containing protein [Nitratireductor basaltis]|uniref:Redoxin n=1 Tax=Nitratireductor basaltis TaxID=472175 RepID=A0A084UBS7_9HYPH|nr:redoxin domain-containing protein [Nitratireductor basaltis]KFB10413.1 Redoxin [Nitratireductor basaltis]